MLYHRSIVVLFLCTVLFPLPARTEDPMKVGVILPLTGPAAAVGESIQSGIDMALDELPRGWIRLTVEDDQNLPRVTTAAFQKMVNNPRIDVLITATAQPSFAVAPLAGTRQVVHFAAAVPPSINRGRPWSFLFFATPERLANSLIGEAVRRGYRRIVRANALHEGRMAMEVEFDKQNGGRLSIVAEDSFSVDERDFRAFLSRVRNTQFDALYVNLYFGQMGVFARQARELGITAPIITTDILDNVDEIETANGTLEGQWYVSQCWGGENFIAAYSKRYPGVAPYNAANGYDLMHVLYEAWRGGRSKGEALRSYIEAPRTVRGALGEYSNLPDRRFDIPVCVKEVRDGRIVTLDAIRAVASN